VFLENCTVVIEKRSKGDFDGLMANINKSETSDSQNDCVTTQLRKGQLEVLEEYARKRK